MAISVRTDTDGRSDGETVRKDADGRTDGRTEGERRRPISRNEGELKMAIETYMHDVN